MKKGIAVVAGAVIVGLVGLGMMASVWVSPARMSDPTKPVPWKKAANEDPSKPVPWKVAGGEADPTKPVPWKIACDPTKPVPWKRG